MIVTHCSPFAAVYQNIFTQKKKLRKLKSIWIQIIRKQDKQIKKNETKKKNTKHVAGNIGK